jgi:hypothetical protein
MYYGIALAQQIVSVFHVRRHNIGIGIGINRPSSRKNDDRLEFSLGLFSVDYVSVEGWKSKGYDISQM